MLSALGRHAMEGIDDHSADREKPGDAGAHPVTARVVQTWQEVEQRPNGERAGEENDEPSSHSKNLPFADIYISMRKRWNDEQLVKAVAESTSLVEVMQKLGLKLSCNQGGGSSVRIRDRIVALGIETSHWARRSNKGYKRKRLEDVLAGKKVYASSNGLRDRLVAEGILPYLCRVCGLSEWCGRPLGLQLDHINGNRFDDRIENLRLLCPNCHSQTESFSRGQKPKSKKPQRVMAPRSS